MNWDRVKGNWKQFKGKVRQQWGKLTDDHLEVIAGNREELAGKLQEAYGVSKEEAEDQIRKFEDRFEDLLPDETRYSPAGDRPNRQSLRSRS